MQTSRVCNTDRQTEYGTLSNISDDPGNAPNHHNGCLSVDLLRPPWNPVSNTHTESCCSPVQLLFIGLLLTFCSYLELEQQPNQLSHPSESKAFSTPPLFYATGNGFLQLMTEAPQLPSARPICQARLPAQQCADRVAIGHNRNTLKNVTLRMSLTTTTHSGVAMSGSSGLLVPWVATSWLPFRPLEPGLRLLWGHHPTQAAISGLQPGQ